MTTASPERAAASEFVREISLIPMRANQGQVSNLPAQAAKKSGRVLNPPLRQPHPCHCEEHHAKKNGHLRDRFKFPPSFCLFVLA
jgi:hypothetical protein